MTEHSFTVVLDGDTTTDENIDALFEAGCDGGTFSSALGVQRAEFTREAPSLTDAVVSVIHNIESVPGFKVLSIDVDDLVTASEIAERLEVSREYVRLLAAGERGDGSFPEPGERANSRNPLWRWVDVARWASLATEEEEAARITKQVINAHLTMRNLEPLLGSEARKALHQLASAG